MKIEELFKMVEAIDLPKLQKKYEQRVKNYQKYKDNECKKGKHCYMECWNMSGGWIHWKCSNCGELISEPDKPFTI